jgi:hypothetical protein
MNEEKPTPKPVRPRAADGFKADALKRLKKLDGRAVTVGAQLDELRALMTLIVERMR